MKQLVLAMGVALAACSAAARTPPPAEPAAPAPVASATSAPLAAPLDPHDAFFERVKQQVYRKWDPDTVWKLVDPAGVIYGPRSRLTRLRVSLLPSGALSRIEVTLSSGVLELDDEAIRAFSKAAPFVDPPIDMMKSDNLITFDFGLYYKVKVADPAYVAPASASASAPR
jgi:TonB family protein